jgi:hypothetical protein
MRYTAIELTTVLSLAVLNVGKELFSIVLLIMSAYGNALALQQ